ncbi:MAG: uroporphyrinogen-III C-methyltransferase [Colwellia sp.]|nr:uroporphyrinogen-III C-methyltransferase [Colwellia sp.]
MTEKKQPLDNDQQDSSEKKMSPTTSSVNKADKLVNEKNNSRVTMTNKNTTAQSTNKMMPKAKMSKTAIAAFIIALVGITGTAASYYWLNEQRLNLTEELRTENQKINTANQQNITQQLQDQQNKFSQQLQQMAVKVQNDSQQKITQLELAVSRLEQNKPSDWLIHEAEYLIRIAARTMWLERDTNAAINLLKDAEQRLAELNSPEFLPVRKVIHQDIEQLKLMPVLNTENVVLSLMGLNNQLANLPLIMEQVTEEKDNTPLELSENIDDWQDNLAKTWRNFLDTFVVIHVRDGSAKPLLSPQYQQNLKENLSLKLQQAQWAAREEQVTVYLQTLTEIQSWLTDYFDMKETSNQMFLSAIEQLKTELISYDYPSTLSSLSAIRNILADQPIAIKRLTAPTETPDKQTTVKKEQKQLAPPTQESAPKKQSIEEQIHQQTTIQEQADEKSKLDEGEI